VITVTLTWHKKVPFFLSKQFVYFFCCTLLAIVLGQTTFLILPRNIIMSHRRFLFISFFIQFHWNLILLSLLLIKRGRFTYQFNIWENFSSNITSIEHDIDLNTFKIRWICAHNAYYIGLFFSNLFYGNLLASIQMQDCTCANEYFKKLNQIW